MVVIAWLGQGHAESGHQVRSGFVFNLAASSISRKESSWGQGVVTSPAQVISSFVEAELTLRSSVWNDKTQFGALYERMKAENLHQHQRAGVILQSDGRISILLHEGHWKPSSRHKIRPTAGQKPCFRQHILSTVIPKKKIFKSSASGWGFFVSISGEKNSCLAAPWLTLTLFSMPFNHTPKSAG